jgi:ABC-type glutathione transport system ATPase component
MGSFFHFYIPSFNFNFDINYFYLLNASIIILLLFFGRLAIKGVGLLDYLHFKKLPKNFGIKSETKNGKKVYDKLKFFNNKRLIYKNRIRPNFDLYMKFYDDIKQFLNVDFLRIKRYGRKGVLLEIKDLLKTFEINKNNFLKYYKKGYIYFGRDENDKNIYKEIDEMKHLLVVGQSGAGKSVLVNNLINSLLFNKTKMFLIDLKGGVEFNKYNKYEFVDVVDNLKDLEKMLDNLVKIMNNRLQKMKEKGETFSSEKPIFAIFDEIQSINDNKEILGKKLYDKMVGQLQELLSKARATNIKIFIITQKPDNINTNLRNNIQYKIIMKLNNNTALQTALGGSYKEIIDEVGIYPKYFTVGKFLFEDETKKGVVYRYLQSPYVNSSLNFLENRNKKNKINLEKVRKD